MVLGVHLDPGGGVTSSGETMSTVDDFTGDDFCAGGDFTVGFGGGVLAGLGWRGHSPAGGAVLTLERIQVPCLLSASFFLPGVFFCRVRLCRLFLRLPS